MNYIKTVAFIFFTIYCSSIVANVDEYFNKISKDPNLLYTFFKGMPKGGDLHYHLAGGPYPETLLKLAATGDYCLSKKSFVVAKTTPCEGIPSKELFKHPLFYLDVIKSWSFKDFSPGKISGHDHFFNAFDKFFPIVKDFRPELLANVIQRASKQKVQYLEVIVLTDNGKSAKFGEDIKDINSFSRKRNALLNNPQFKKNITYTIEESDRILNKAYTHLACEENSNSSLCKTKLKLLYYVFREQPLDNVFAQALNAFEAVKGSQGNLVGVNLVAAEDGVISLKDYRQQMAIFNYLHQLYPGVKITLHAGELTPKLVDAKELTHHIHDALFTGHAQRIGHGTDIKYENNAQYIVNYMATHHIPVEISLISNLKLLGLAGPNHPLNYYLKNKVPVVLSTDDEGILRTDLTQQYVTAVLANGLTYQELKQINRNGLTYSFLSGKNLWANAEKAEPVPACKDLNSDRCKEFIKTSEKANLQWLLEQKLNAFEKKY